MPQSQKTRTSQKYLEYTEESKNLHASGGETYNGKNDFRDTWHGSADNYRERTRHNVINIASAIKTKGEYELDGVARARMPTSRPRVNCSARAA